MIDQHGITHVLTVITIYEIDYVKPKLPASFDKNNWLFLNMDDVIDADVPLAPQKEQVAQILEWGRSLPADAKVLVHCFAGVSRSTASALALKVQELGVDKLDECIEWLVNHRPIACPNPVITKHADELLCANGLLHQKAEAVASAKLIKGFGTDWKNHIERTHLKE